MRGKVHFLSYRDINVKPIVIILVALLGLLQYELWFVPGGAMSAYRLHKAMATQTRTNKQLEKRNAVVTADIKDLKKGNDAVEERARNDLGMIKKGEVFYQVVK